MSEFRKVITKPGEVIDFETVFEEHPGLRTAVPMRKGTVKRVDYTTDVYEDGKVYPKYCYVYLPWCYDENDRSRKYNVLYYQHGNTCEPSLFAIGGNKYMFDMLFESGEIDPCIIVSTTYYFDPMENSAERITTGMLPAGDGGYPGVVPNFWKEIVKDVIPAVEGSFNTYLTDVSDAGIKASRDHRAFSGYSRGAVMTWRMLHYDFEYFRWFCPMSCCVRGDRMITDTIEPEEVIEYVTRPILDHPELPFFIYASNGAKYDIAEMNEQMKYLPKESCFSYGTDPQKNNFYYCLSDYYHTDHLVPYYYWNSLKVLFKGI